MGIEGNDTRGGRGRGVAKITRITVDDSAGPESAAPAGDEVVGGQVETVVPPVAQPSSSPAGIRAFWYVMSLTTVCE